MQRTLKVLSKSADGLLVVRIYHARIKTYLVKLDNDIVTWYNGDDDIIYRVTMRDLPESCTCPGFTHYKKCRHIDATNKLLQLQHL